MKDILDNDINQEAYKKPIINIGVTFLAVAVLYVVIEWCRANVEITPVEYGEAKIYPVGLLHLIPVVAASILFPKYLHRVRPRIPSIWVVGLSVILIVVLEAVKYIIQDMHYRNVVGQLPIVYSDILKSVLLVRCIGLVISTFKLKNLRK